MGSVGVGVKGQKVGTIAVKNTLDDHHLKERRFCQKYKRQAKTKSKFPSTESSEGEQDVVLAVLIYIGFTAAQAIVEKVSLIHINDPLLLIVLEITFSLVSLLPVVYYRQLRFSASELVRWVPTAVFFSLSLILGKFALGAVSLGTIEILKMARPAVILVIETTVFQKARIKIRWQTIAALTVLFGGTVIYAMDRGLNGELSGILVMFGAILASTIDRIWCRYLMVNCHKVLRSPFSQVYQAEEPSTMDNISIMLIYYTFALIAALLLSSLQNGKLLPPVEKLGTLHWTASKNSPSDDDSWLGVAAWICVRFV
mmetsp:Transcript_5836/g.11575  ORF Transcript_5836/g.11575 Transcript_5836/m.11575 type:complete len:313 (-) Transcript_5836:1899-2837(-)